MRHIIPISGKDSLATAIVQTKLEPELPYEFMFNPTGAELPEVSAWIAKVETYLGRPIQRVGDDLESIIEDYNYFLPSRQSRYCTKESKIWPMEKFIGAAEATVYYGIRADEVRIGYNGVRGNITARNPLQENKIGLRGVYELINNEGLKPPTFFWKSVHEQVINRLGELPVLPEWIFDPLFAWRTRANCYFCFNQRRYEFVGLLEHHPELYWKAEAMERKGSERGFYWLKDISLADLAKKADQIREKRIKAILATIYDLSQLKLPFPKDDGFIDTLNVTSCGLFCGK